jgi:DNA primase
MTTIGKLNFFRWALESKILDYIEAHEEDIRKGYNSYLKDTTQTQKRVKNETASSTDSNVSAETVQSAATQITQTTNTTRSTRRRRTKQTPSSLNKLQVYTTPIELNFD